MKSDYYIIIYCHLVLSVILCVINQTHNSGRVQHLSFVSNFTLYVWMTQVGNVDGVIQIY